MKHSGYVHAHSLVLTHLTFTFISTLTCDFLAVARGLSVRWSVVIQSGRWIRGLAPPLAAVSPLSDRVTPPPPHLRQVFISFLHSSFYQPHQHHHQVWFWFHTGHEQRSPGWRSCVCTRGSWLPPSHANHRHSQQTSIRGWNKLLGWLLFFGKSFYELRDTNFIREMIFGVKYWLLSKKKDTK